MPVEIHRSALSAEYTLATTAAASVLVAANVEGRVRRSSEWVVRPAGIREGIEIVALVSPVREAALVRFLNASPRRDDESGEGMH
jgi:hypothetical protein